MTRLVSLYPEFKLSYSAQIPEHLRHLIYSGLSRMQGVKSIL